ncbi:toxin-antitoxin system TumE family protein [Thermodesulfovibrio yellowstonii]|uniref:Uncharacterized protein n=1 Tax=Thermodesulfovibrio yellowstonii TaxID=28262 RepID=A0A9W6GF09_9BACT|nr:DUF6516 family protein [Thermodesulfovibrio islandicus]GLI52945.1 hypothetical protein TISLANDTSLP1_06380 [Thermodesulfovibrio islandicus]
MQESPKIWRLYNRLLSIAIDEFRDIVESGEIFCSNITKEPLKLRLYLCDESFIDIYYSIKGKYSYHWNRMLTHNEIYRHDNAPHFRWQKLSTFPKHFHNGSENNVISSSLSDDPETAIREFLNFVMEKLKRKN